MTTQEPIIDQPQVELSHSVDAASPVTVVQQSKGRSKRAGEGGQLGNRNALRHGLRAGRLPPGCSWIASQTAELRTALEDAVVALRGEIAIVDAAAINTALRCERHALLCQKLLRDKWDELDHSERLSYSREITTASAARDKAIDRLGIETAKDSGWVLPAAPAGDAAA